LSANIRLAIKLALQKDVILMATPAVRGGLRVEKIFTSYNIQLSEMSVGVETCSLLLPLTVCDSSGDGAPSPPLRQAAGRYTK